MKVNADFAQRVVVHSADMAWVDSPMPGVSRKLLDRVGDEVARATTIVNYAPGSHFSPHVHTGGEEFLVLEGVFQDEHADYPAGSYIRNPPQSSHTPGSEAGCVIFVKLWQFELDDRTHVSLDSEVIQRSFIASEHAKAEIEATIENTIESTVESTVESTIESTIETAVLHADDHEQVSIQRWPVNQMLSLDLPKGAEFLVLDGGFDEGGDQLRQGSWLRLPCASQLKAKVGQHGAKVWLKQGHLDMVEQQVERLPQTST